MGNKTAIMRGFVRRRWPWFAAAAGMIAGLAALPPVYRIALAGAGFKAHMLCSGVFVSKRDPQSVLHEDLSAERYAPLRYFGHGIDLSTESVTASFHGVARQLAIHRRGLGCTLVQGGHAVALRAQALDPLPTAADTSAARWPDGDRVEPEAPVSGVDGAALQRAIDGAFAEPEAGGLRKTRALVVVHRGRMVAERYAPGFHADMPLIGWSMTKTATNALIGRRIAEGKLSAAQTGLMPQWRGANDPRRTISLDQLLHMESGLAFDETYDSALSDVVQMLFVHGDKAGFVAGKGLEHAPGTHWKYKSGATIIAAAVLKQSFDTLDSYLRFPREALFAPLGMRSAVLEADAAGTLVGSSLMYASARDWARLGLLYLRDGVWNGRRLFPEGWVEASLRPARHAPEAQYGAHTWLKLPESPGFGEPPMPADSYYMLGHDQQVVAIIPSRDLVIVRLGLTVELRAWRHGPMLAPIVAAFPEVERSGNAGSGRR